MQSHLPAREEQTRRLIRAIEKDVINTLPVDKFLACLKGGAAAKRKV